MDYPESLWEFLKNLFASNDFAPHGHCYLWRSEIVWLHVISDFVIAFSYYSIPLALIYFIRRRRDVHFRWMFMMFGAFILACGTTHFMNVVTVWHPVYRFDGVVKAATALLSLSTAVALWALMPQALKVPSPSQLQAANKKLQGEIAERERVEDALRLQSEIVANMAEGVCLVRATDGFIIYTNAKFDSMFGYNPGGLAGKPASILNHGEGGEPAAVARTILAGVEEHGSWIGEIQNRRKDGTPFWCRATISRLEHGEHGVVHVTVQSDITENKRTEDAMAYHAAIINSSNDAIVGRTLDGSIATWNPGAESMFGYTVAEIVDQPSETLVPADRVEELTEVLGRIRAGETVAPFETVRRRKDGSQIDVSMTLSPIRDKAGMIIGISSIARDITRRRLMEESLRESEERYRAVVQTARDGIISADDGGRIVFWNKSAEAMFGFQENEVLSKPLSMLMPERYRASHRESFERFLTTGEARVIGKRVELHGLRKDGSEFPLELSLAVWATQRGRFFTGVVRDITASKQAEQELARERNLLRSLIDNIPDHIYVKDVQGRYVLDNPAHAHFLGGTSAEVLGKRVFDFFSEPNASEYHADDMAVVQSGKPLINKEEPLPSSSGDILWVTTTKVPLKDADGKIAGIVCLSRDITERKAAQETLQKTAAELERSNAELQQFAYVTSHDLQEPLRVVASYLQLLERGYKGKLDAEADDFIERAVNGVKRMQRLIGDLLEYSRVGTRGEEFSPVSCTVALAQALDNLETAIRENEAKVISDQLPEVRGDSTQLAQLFQNLVGNALKFHGTKSPRVQIGVRRQNGDWLFSVQDNGIGLDPQYRDRIFLIFQRLHTRSEYPGTGVGLAICKKIVERHGGRIWVESQPNAGATFYFTIPAEETVTG